MGELFWVAKHILHHVDSGTGIVNARKMKKQNGEEQAELDRSTHVESELDLCDKEEAPDKESLNGAGEQGLPEQFELVILCHAELLFVFLHECKEASAVHVRTYFQSL